MDLDGLCSLVVAKAWVRGNPHPNPRLAYSHAEISGSEPLPTLVQRHDFWTPLKLAFLDKPHPVLITTIIL